MKPPEVIHRDDHLLVINKPANVSLLADRSGAPCLWDALTASEGRKLYLVSCLDKPTSGVLALALDQPTQRTLTRRFQARQVRKFYLARVAGHPGAAGLIDLPLRKGRKSRYRVAGLRQHIRLVNGGWQLAPPSGDGHPSQTRFRTLARDPASSLLLLAPRTGRTHQLRVHLAWIGHPILGDALYGRPGDPAQQAGRLLLHARKLVLPGHGAFTAPVPGDWR